MVTWYITGVSSALYGIYYFLSTFMASDCAKKIRFLLEHKYGQLGASIWLIFMTSQLFGAFLNVKNLTKTRFSNRIILHIFRMMWTPPCGHMTTYSWTGTKGRSISAPWRKKTKQHTLAKPSTTLERIFLKANCGSLVRIVIDSALVKPMGLVRSHASPAIKIDFLYFLTAVK